MNYKMTISYDGTDFFGWQRQNSEVRNSRSVQGEIEKALKKMTKEDIGIHGAGRTDAGVHALGQVAMFSTDLPLPVEKMPEVLNLILPSDVSIVKVEVADDDFHPRFSAIAKTYRYYVAVGGKRSAFSSRFVYYHEKFLDVEKMAVAAKLFVGEHDFANFSGTMRDGRDSKRRVYDCRFFKSDASDVDAPVKGVENLYCLEICGNGFVYKMVRMIMGSLLFVGRGTKDLDFIEKALNEPEMQALQLTAKPQGLYMKEIFYSQSELDGFLAR